MNVLVIAPHPDDETLGCGGTILKHIEKNDKVFWLIVTDIREEKGFSRERVKTRREEIEKVKSMYGFKDVLNLKFNTMELDITPMKALVDSISKYILDIKAEVVYMPNCSDVHSDHKYVAEATLSCVKCFRYPSIKKVYVYETLSETEFGINNSFNKFMPNVYVNIEKYIAKKIEILEVFKSEIGIFPFPRSKEGVVALSQYRGLAAGYKNAEAFILLKQNID